MLLSYSVQSDSSSYIFVPYAEKLAKNGLICANSVHCIQSEKISVRILNNGQETTLNKGVTVGYLEKVENYCSKVFQFCKNSIEDFGTMCKENVKFNLDHLSPSEKKQTMEIIDEYRDVFSKDKNDIGLTDVVKHSIDTNTDRPIFVRPRRQPLAMENKVDQMVTDLINQGVVEPCSSPWNAPVVLVPKKNGDMRMCVDYRSLNSVTDRPIFHIPCSSQLFDTIGGNSFFSTLDLSSGYYQVPIKDSDKTKTAFTTRHGQYQFNRMPFGLCGAPATFQKMMSLILKGQNWKECVVYLDDVLIFGKDLNEHNERLRKVLQIVKDSGLKLAPAKCTFLKKEVKYLGHIVSNKGVEVDPNKTAAIKDWPLPKSVAELKSFLGLTGYYRRFIQSYSTITTPLDKMTHNRSLKDSISWETSTLEKFDHLKKCLISAPVLNFPNESMKYILDTDASNDNIGAVLGQVDAHGRERVIAYGSRRLTASEQRYCITRKELLAIHFFVHHFKTYLIGREFIIRTDHKALKWILDWQNPNTSQYSIWKADLELFNFKIEYRKGQLHVNADALSRPGQCYQCPLAHPDPRGKTNVKYYNDQPLVDTKKLCSMEISEQDKDLLLIKDSILSGRKLDRARASDESFVNDILKFENKLKVTNDTLYLVTASDHRLVTTVNQGLYYTRKFHNKLCHPGITKLLGFLVKKFYWPSMSNTVKYVVDNCINCQIFKDKVQLERAPMKSINPSQPFEVVNIDVAGPFPRTKNNKIYALIMIDCFSKFSLLIPIQSTSSQTIVNAIMSHWIAVFGTPKSLLSDNASYFKSESYQNFCKNMEIDAVYSSPYYPQTNGHAERLVKTMKNMLYPTLESANSTWDTLLPLVSASINSLDCVATGYSPNEIIFGKSNENDTYESLERYVNQSTDTRKSILAKVKLNLRKACQKRKDRYDANRYFHLLEVNDTALICNPTQDGPSFKKPKFIGPYIVRQTLPNNNYVLENMRTNKRVIRNHNQVKKIRIDTSVVREKKTRNHDTLEWTVPMEPFACGRRSMPSIASRNVQEKERMSTSRKSVPVESKRGPIRAERIMKSLPNSFHFRESEAQRSEKFDEGRRYPRRDKRKPVRYL